MGTLVEGQVVEVDILAPGGRGTGTGLAVCERVQGARGGLRGCGRGAWHKGRRV